MRWGMILAAAVIALPGKTMAQPAPEPAASYSRTAVDCGWAGLSEAQQRYMVLNGASERTNTSITVVMAGLPPNLDIPALAQDCGLTADGVIPLAMGLKWRAKEEGAREALVKLGRDPAAIEAALGYLLPARRVQMGDALSCPNSMRIQPDWDRSVATSINRTHNRTLVGTSFSLVALAIFARAGQEGAQRHIEGDARPCPAR